MVNLMGRGINMGNVLSAPVEGNWAHPVYEDYFVQLSEAGFTNVRIPVDFYSGGFLNSDYSINGSERSSINIDDCASNSCFSSNANTASNYNGSLEDYQVNEEYLDRVQQIVDWAIDHSIIVILDFHGNNLKEQFVNTFQNEQINGVNYYANPTSAKRLADINRFKSIWRDISNRFKDYSNDQLVFDIINEPYFSISANEMDELNLEIISTIRSTGSNNLTRSIIINGGGTSSWEVPFEISSEVITSDDYLIATFHYYQPFNFTASSREQYNNFVFSQAQKDLIIDRFSQLKTWSENNDIPIYLGEFGADNSNGVNYFEGSVGDFGGPYNLDRVEYHRFIADEAIANNFSFSAWCAGNKSTKTISLRNDNPNNISINPYTNEVITENWIDDVKEALIGCPEDELIQNPNFDCIDINNSWSLTNYGGANAEYTDAFEQSLHESSSFIDVQSLATNNSGFNKVILNNVNYFDDLNGKTINIKFYAKTSAEFPASSFKLRIKKGSSGNNYSVSNEIFLSDEYELKEVEFNIEQYFDVFKFQLMCGNDLGHYYFDSFNVTVNEINMSVDESFSDVIKVYPNPSNGLINLNFNNISSLNFDMFTISGKLIKCYTDYRNNQLDFRHLNKGVYFIQFYIDNKVIVKKIIKN
jgi:endoglucanase